MQKPDVSFSTNLYLSVWELAGVIWTISTECVLILLARDEFLA